MIFLEKPEPESSENHNMDLKVQALECLFLLYALGQVTCPSRLRLTSEIQTPVREDIQGRHQRATLPLSSLCGARVFGGLHLRHPWHSSRTPDPGINHPPTFGVIVSQVQHTQPQLHLAPAHR